MNENLITRAMLQDQHWLRKTARKLQNLQHGSPSYARLERQFANRLQASIARREARAKGIPKIEFANELPIMQHRDQIVAALREHQVIVVAGETGSGKSTQLPKICLQAGYGISGLIGHTQPRRIAARSVAQRIAEEIGRPLGEAVGYKIRFQDKTHPNTYVKLMTDGILLAEAAGDRFLEDYEVIILDEAHERSLNVDFLLGLLHGLLQKRRELKLIITSATIDAARFGEHFGTIKAPAPVITVQGRTYPVEVRYRQLQDEAGTAVDVVEGIIEAVHELSGEGDILVFLPTERDIRETAKRLRADKLMQQQRREILPLYARLSTKEQDKIFRPGPARRIVLATNVAESSLTVPRIHCVIDTGTARISRFSSRLRMQRLPVEPVSRASADQRMGRCGRLGPGTCVRLYSEEDFASRPEYTTPEIRRTNLASVILQAKFLRLGEVDTIPFLDPPRPETIREGYKTLFEIGAVDTERQLTKIGRVLATLPVDPRIGRMVIAGHEENCLSEVLLIAAALEVQDPRVRPIEKQQEADAQHAKFVDQHSDFLTFLKIWDYVQEKRTELSRGRFQKMCDRNFLSPSRLREWSEVHRQLRQIAIDHGFQCMPRRDDAVAIHRAILTGLLSCAALRNDEFEYSGAGGNKFFIWPGSGVFKAKPQWIMAAELVETTRRFGRTVAKIRPEWLESLGAHLTKQTYSDPHWHERSQSVMAFEKVTLFGLPVVARRRVPYGHLDVEVARQIFIEHGLVAQKMSVDDRFFRHNARLLEEIERLAAKTRKRECLLDEYAIHEFYEQRVPEDVYDLASLRHRIKTEPDLEQQLLMSMDRLIGDKWTLDARQFPLELDLGTMTLPLSYHFEPGSEADGVTVTAPQAAVSQLYQDQLDWLVPGLLEEKLVALIRSLPKSIRRGLVPAPDTAAKVAREMEFGSGVFLSEVCRHFSDVAGEKITPDAFRLDKLAPHLRMRVQVVGDDGEPLAVTRDVRELQQCQGLRDERMDGLPIHSEWHRDNIVAWDFGDIPEEIRVQRGGIEIVQFPTLAELEDGTLGLRLEETSAAAQFTSRKGVRRLFQILNKKSLRTQVRWLPKWDEIGLWAADLFSKTELEDQLSLLIAEVAFLDAEGAPSRARDFESRQQQASVRIAAATQRVAALVPSIMEAYHQARLALSDLSPQRFTEIRNDMETQLARLVHAEFLSETPWNWLSQFPRYLAAIKLRAEKVSKSSAATEAARIGELATLWSRLEDGQEGPDLKYRPALIEYRWMLEEYRVSLFAQQLGTVVKVSPQRLEKQWAKIRR